MVFRKKIKSPKKNKIARYLYIDVVVSQKNMRLFKTQNPTPVSNPKL
jgi:hypothetical protein